MKSTIKKWKKLKLKTRKRICSEVFVKVWGVGSVRAEEEKEGTVKFPTFYPTLLTMLCYPVEANVSISATSTL